MKLYAISLLLLGMCLFSACIDDDTDSCLEPTAPNLTLNFVYPTNGGRDLFAEYIHQVDVFVYDSQDRFVQQQTVDKTSLSVFAGTTMKLPAGKYHLVCWGNALDKTRFDGIEAGSSFAAALSCNATLGGTIKGINGDALYYGPSSVKDTPAQAFYVTVPAAGSETATVDFRSAHVKLEVYIKGFTDQSITRIPLAPVVELTGISADYTFEMETCGSMISYCDVTTSRIIDGVQMDVVDYYPPLCGKETPMELLIKKQSDGTTLTTICLKDFIEEYHIDLTGTAEIVIPILIEYKSIGVSVTLLGWEHNPVGPEL